MSTWSTYRWSSAAGVSTGNGCGNCSAREQLQSPQNRAQNMLVWPGLRLIGGGGKIPKGVFVAVTEVELEHVRLDNGLLKQQELLRATRLSHAVTYASCHRPRQAGPGLRPPVSAPPVRGRVAGDQLRPA